MGCDIHLHTEIKVKGEWLHYGSPKIDRDYNLFSRLANVRNPKDEHWVEPISEPRGLPEDVTKSTKLCSDYEDTDGHSHSWIDADEIEGLYQWYEEKEAFYFEVQFGYLFGNSWQIKRYREDKPEWLEDVRFVFWFDN